MKKRALKTILVLVVLLAMVALVAKRKMQAKAAQPYGVRPVSVHVAPVTQQPLESAHSYLGVLEAWQTAKISSRLSAKVNAVPRDEGDSVKTGELLLQLDDSDIQAEIKAVDSTIQSLQTNKKFWVGEAQRDSQLAKEGVISAVEAKTTQNRMAEAVAKLEALQRNRDSLLSKLVYTKLVSPFDGQISTRDVDPGDLAAPGLLLMVVEDRSALKIGFDAPQEDMQFLKEGLPVRAKVGGKMLDLTVTHIYPNLDRGRMVRVEVTTPADPDFQIGSFVPLSVVWKRHDQAITVPIESMMQRAADDWVVFVVVEGTLQLRPVQKIMESSGRVEVSGVQPEENVVTSTFLGWANLSAGLKVEVSK